YSEALFRTLKYKPGYPVKHFESLEASRDWVLKFVRWYNYEHKHSNLKFISPALRHCGKDQEILEHRKKVYEEARKRNPMRWARKTRNCPGERRRKQQILIKRLKEMHFFLNKTIMKKCDK
ncbi:MAG: transposase, partial [Deltaproteobacteria bacterium]|nr:transposase [Deltaproteobacteria bacterium]